MKIGSYNSIQTNPTAIYTHEHLVKPDVTYGNSSL